MPTVYLIDASPYIFRAYYSLPPTIKTPDGAPANAVLGFTEFLIQVIQKENPTHIAAAFDGSLTTSFRNEIYPEYKANRALPPAELKAQIASCMEVAQAMGVRTFVDDGFEADDIIGTLSTKLIQQDQKVVVVSNDKDFAQLVNPSLLFWDFARNVKYDANVVKEKFGVLPSRIVDLLALAGDSVDNIPGVKGIGRQTAAKLLQSFETLEDLYGRIDLVSELSIRGVDSIISKLKQQRETAFLSRRLVEIVRDGPFAADLGEIRYDGAVGKLIEPLFDRLGFERIRERIPRYSVN